LELSRAAFKSQNVDVHTRLMRQYKQVPQFWFLGILVVTIAIAIAACETYNEQLQLPWWGVILACIIAFVFTLPIGIIRATTNQVIKSF
jgi:magnesium-transporting ATPase (P-type)